MPLSTWVKDKVEHLNKNYHGSFRALSDDEVKKYSEILNKGNNQEWYKPYAIREETNDIVCRHDTPYGFSNALFCKVVIKKGV